MRFAKSATLGFVALMVLACGGPSIPSIPPLPSFPFPSSGLPSGLLPSGLLPSGVLPSADANSGTCLLISVAEMGSIMGGVPTVTGNSGDECTYTFSNLSTILVTIDSDTDLASSRFSLGQAAKDITVAGLPAVSGSLIFLNQPAVHVQRGTDQLQVQGVLLANDDATIAKLVQIATIAVGRWPS